MSSIRFVSSVAEALKGRDAAVLFAPLEALRDGLAAKVFKGKGMDVIEAMVASASGGGLGQVVSTWVAGRPARVAVAVLPDALSRHLPPSRSQAIQHCASKLELGGVKSLGVILALDENDHWLPAANAVARCLPLYDRRTGDDQSSGGTPDAVFVAVSREGRALKVPDHVAPAVEATRWAASLVDTPTAELTTEEFVRRVRQEVKGLDTVKTRQVVGDDLLKKGFGGIHAVGRAAEVPPRLLLLEHRPKKSSRGAPHVALVGKGIVYDTGGLSLKVGGSMPGMKSDMGGAAAVVGAFVSLAKVGYPGRLSALVPLAENAIGPSAYRPDDILTMHSGKTVEINNTDAEGRLLLADAVSHAARDLKADVVVDAATLTGAQLVATGKVHAAVVSNRAGLEAAAVRSGLASGDPVHSLPFAPELFQRELKSEVADMTNSVKDRRNAQTSCAAQFVWSHADDTECPWLHVDLAGPAFPDRRGTGYGVALLSELVRGLKASDLE